MDQPQSLLNNINQPHMNKTNRKMDNSDNCEERLSYIKPGLVVDNTIFLTTDHVMPIVLDPLDKFSDKYWDSILAGTWTKDQMAALCNVLTEIIGTLSVDILPVVTYIIMMRKNGSYPPCDSLDLRLGDSLTNSFFECLGVPLDRYQSAHEMTEKVERQICHRLNCAVSLAVKRHLYPPEAAIYMKRSVCVTDNIQRIGSLAVTFLKVIADILNEPRSESRCSVESTDSIISQLSLTSTTESMKEFLNKCSSHLLLERKSTEPTLMRRDNEDEELSKPVAALKFSESLDSLVSVHEESESTKVTNILVSQSLSSKHSNKGIPKLFECSESSSSSEATTNLIAVPKPKDEANFHPQKTTNAISILLVKVIVASLYKSRKSVSLQDFHAILKRMLELPLDHIDVSADRITKKMEQISKSMVKDLHMVFGSAENLFKAAVRADDPSFVNAVMMVLKINLKIIPRPDNMKSAAAMFFSAVGQAFMKPFRCCLNPTLM